MTALKYRKTCGIYRKSVHVRIVWPLQVKMSLLKHIIYQSFGQKKKKKTTYRKVPHRTKEVESSRMECHYDQERTELQILPTFHGGDKRRKGTKIEYQKEKGFETTK